MTATGDPANETERRLRALLAANALVTANLALTDVLSQVVHAARDLLDARFAALGVLGPGGELAQFLHAGIDEQTAAALGPLPRGRGALGLLLDQPHAVRLDDLAAHPASFGFPPGHPPMRAFLGAPIQIRGEVFGSIYLTDKRDGAPFTEQDEDLLVALAATAAVAVDHARRHEESLRRQHRHQATARVTTALLAQARSTDVLRLVMAEGRLLVEADGALVTRRARGRHEHLHPSAPDGQDPGRWYQPTPGLPCEVTRLSEESGVLVSEDLGTDERFADPRDPEFGPLIAAPLAGEGGATPVLVLTRRRGRPPFTAGERDALEQFCEQVAVALERARLRADGEQIRMVAERDRIARDMHDHVIGRLIGSGMSVQGLTRWITDPAGLQRLSAHVEDLDAAVRDLRTVIHGLDREPAGSRSLAARIQGVLDEAALHLGFAPTLEIDQDLRLPPGSTAPDQLLAVLREALANVVRHAAAGTVDVTVTGGTRLVLVVADDGRGLPDRWGDPTATGGHGLPNVARRAADLEGSLWLGTGPRGGALLRWSVPVASPSWPDEEGPGPPAGRRT